MKVVYNGCFGGFSLSHDGIMRYAEIKGTKLYPFIDRRDRADFKSPREYTLATDEEARHAWMVFYCTTPTYSEDDYWECSRLERDDPALVQVVEEMGDRANGQCAKLRIDDVQPGKLWRIDEYDGNESVMTQDEYEWKLAV